MAACQQRTRIQRGLLRKKMANLSVASSVKIKREPVGAEDYSTNSSKCGMSTSESPNCEILALSSRLSPGSTDLSPPPNKKYLSSRSTVPSHPAHRELMDQALRCGTPIDDSVSSRSTPNVENSPLSPKEPSPSAYEHCEESQSSQILKFMDEKRIAGKFVDLVLVAEDKEIPCHKVVICAVSDHFSQMLDLSSPEIQRHTIKETSFEVLSQLISFAYTSRIVITDGNIQQLLSASTFFKMSAVRSACMCFLRRKINPSNSVVLEKFAVSQGCTELANFSHSYTLNNFTDVTQTLEFLEISSETLLAYISSDELNVQQEELVYSAVISWVRHNVTKRQCYLSTLMENIRLPLIKPQFLLDVVQEDPLVKSTKECETLLDEARRFQLLVDQRPLMQSSRTQPRNSYKVQTSEILVVVGGLNKDKVSVPDCFYYCFPDICNKALAKLKVLQTAYSVATVNNNIFITGGALNSSCKDVWVYVPSLDVWQQVAPLSEARYLHTSVGLGNYLYVAGGHNGTERLDSVERYNPDSNTWVKVQPMLEPLSSCTAVTCDGCLYIIGGARGPSPSEIVSAVQCYDPTTNSWTSVESLPQPERGAVAANLNGIIYVFGQHRGVYAYNKHINRWKKMSNTHGGHLHGAATVHKGRLYIAGGLHGNNYINGTIEMYDQLNDSWCFFSTLGTPVYAQGFVSIFKDIK